MTRPARLSGLTVGERTREMELAGRQHRYNQLRNEAPTTVRRLELGMLAAVIVSHAMGRTVWVRDPAKGWPNPDDRDDARPDR
jgi:hypothetical protein